MNTVDALRHEFLTDVAEAAERTALDHGIDPAVAEQIGCAVADMMCAEYPGIRIYIALDMGYRLAPRDREICLLRAEGKTIPELAKQFSLSEERIRQIIKRRDVRDPDFGQGKLFEEAAAGR
ncbi:MAG: hypothetical protein LBL59_12015 [Xanthomonadaceae bacterium]|jgi:Mor family transcriptional regulator|nr:hypothetical protein [Xanthomonadaceae bacterium]